jgi:hypothetical protein
VFGVFWRGDDFGVSGWKLPRFSSNTRATTRSKNCSRSMIHSVWYDIYVARCYWDGRMGMGCCVYSVRLRKSEGNTPRSTNITIFFRNKQSCEQGASAVKWLSHSMFAGVVILNCHLPAVGRNYMTHRQVLEAFPVTSQVSLHKTIKSTYLLKNGGENYVPVHTHEYTV